MLGRNGVKPLAADILSHGIDLKDALLSKVDTLKEGAEDLLAEAQHAAEQRRDKRETAASSKNA